MNIKSSLLASALATGLATASLSAQAASHRYVVELAPGADTARITQVLQANNVRVARVLSEAGQGDILAVDVDFANLPNLNVLRAQLPEVTDYYSDVKRFPLAVPATPIQDVAVGNEVVPWGIQAVGSLDVPYAGGRKVCIIDSGYDLGHPDLQTERIDGEDEGAGFWGDANSTQFHGTHVAGTIAAIGGNNTGVVGVIPTDDLDLHIVRVFGDDGWIYASELAGAIEDCAAAGANVVNMSLGGKFSSRAEQRAVNKVNRNGVLLVAASGNGSSIAGALPRNDFATYLYPAGYAAVMSVGAVNSNLVRSDFSQYTADLEIVGPGTDVLSTFPRNQFRPQNRYLLSGTSMATPHVAGVAALVWSHFPQCTNDQIRDALKKSAHDLNAPGFDYETGYGLVRAPEAVAYLQANGCKGTGRGLR